MASIQKKWSEVIGAYNLTAQMVQNSEKQLEAIKHLEKNDKSKEDIKEQLEQNAKNKPLFTEISRVYRKLLEHLQELAETHDDKATEINIDHALEIEVTPAKEGATAVKKLLLDEKGNYCFDRAGEKAKAKAFKKLNDSTVMVPQLEIATTLTEKAPIFEGILLFTKLVEKPRPPLKSIPKKK